MASEQYFATVLFEANKNIDYTQLDNLARLYEGRKTVSNPGVGMIGYTFHFEESAEGFRERTNELKGITDIVVGKVR